MNFNQGTYRLFCAIIVCLAALFGSNLSVFAEVAYVDGSVAMCDNDGTTWGNAFKYLQDALAEASEFGSTIDQIWVAAGTYLPDHDCANPDGSCSPLPCDQSASFELVDGVKLYGGFDGTEIFLVDRDPENNITILTGDIDQDGDAHDIDNSWHVVTADGVGGATLINGFTISDGYADGGGMDNNGAGILILDANLFIVRCTLTRNDAFNGGGMYVDVTGTAAPTFFNCSIIDNVTSWEGGAMRVEGNAELILVVNCLFALNFSQFGGIYATGPDADFINCTF